MRPLLTFLILSWFPVNLFSQSHMPNDLLAGPEWFQGSLLLNSGNELNGLIKYNDKTDIVSIESGRLSKSFTARHVKAFEFFDEIEKKQRIFYSIEMEDRIYNVKRPLFFEVLVDSKNFALISKVAPIRMDKREYATPAMFNPATGGFTAGRYYGYPSTISHTETVFFFSREGELRPFLEIKEKDIDGIFIDRSFVKNTIVDESLLERFTGSQYKQLIRYAKEHDLNIKKRNDLVALLEHYTHIQAAENDSAQP